MLHLFVVLYSFSLFVCLILMVELYNIFADSKKKEIYYVWLDCKAA
jgi:hypothetical protein